MATVPELSLQHLRSFLAVADELHFGRAAMRLFLAQQVVSRHIAKLEKDLATPLFVRSTRSVALTAAGERLIPHARRLLDLHDEAVDDVTGAARSLIVDVLADGLTGSRVLQRAREQSPSLSLVARFGGGTGTALRELTAGRRDVVFGRLGSQGNTLGNAIRRELVRYEPLAILIPDGHPLAGGTHVRCDSLGGEQIDVSLGNTAAPEWTELGLALIELMGAEPTPEHPSVEGAAETALHLRETGVPILTRIDAQPVDGGRIVPLVEPVPLYAWELAYDSNLRHPGLGAIRIASRSLGDERDWRSTNGGWLPAADLALATST